MTKNNTVEKIDQIINKIEENIAKKLSKEEAQELLMDIDKELKEVEKGSEEKKQQTAVKELREKIDESLSEEDGWGKIKMLLNKDVKGGLVELKNEIIALEEVSISIPTFSISKDMEADLEELAEWRKLFDGQTPKEAAKKVKEIQNAPSKSTGISSEVLDVFQEKNTNLSKEIKEKENIIQELKNQLEAKDRELEKGKMNTRSKFSYVVQKSEEQAMEIAKLGFKEGNKSLPIVGGLGAGAVGAIAGSASVFTTGVGELFNEARQDAKEFTESMVEVGANVYENTRRGAEKLAEKGVDAGVDLAKEGIDKFDKAREGLKDIVEKSMDNVEKARQGAENLIGKGMDDVEKVIEKNLEVAQAAVEGGIGLQYGAFKVGIGVGKDATTEAKLEAAERFISKLEEQIEKIKEEVKLQLEERKEIFKQQLEEKDKELADKRSELESLRKELGKQTDKGQENLLSVIEIMAKSQSNSPVPSRPSTPSGGKQ